MTAALHIYEHFLLRYKHVWRGTVASSAVSPLLYLAALGIGLGKLLEQAGAPPGGVTYLDFVAPGLLAAAAMQLATTEATFPVHAGFNWDRTYFAMNATPIRARDILGGVQLFILTRVLISSAFYLAVIAALGGAHSFLALLALPAALVTGAAFSAPISAYSAWALSDGAFNPLFRFGIMPMFLFSGTFYPVAQLPDVARWLAYATPLWHGVELCRHLILGNADLLADLGHFGYLLLWTVAGLVLAVRQFRRRLVA